MSLIPLSHAPFVLQAQESLPLLSSESTKTTEKASKERVCSVTKQSFDRLFPHSIPRRYVAITGVKVISTCLSIGTGLTSIAAVSAIIGYVVIKYLFRISDYKLESADDLAATISAGLLTLAFGAFIVTSTWLVTSITKDAISKNYNQWHAKELQITPQKISKAIRIFPHATKRRFITIKGPKVLAVAALIAPAAVASAFVGHTVLNARHSDGSSFGKGPMVVLEGIIGAVVLASGVGAGVGTAASILRCKNHYRGWRQRELQNHPDNKAANEEISSLKSIVIEQETKSAVMTGAYIQ